MLSRRSISVPARIKETVMSGPKEISRRRFVQQCAASAVAFAAPPLTTLAATAATSLTVITKVIPSSGERIPAIGIGTDSFSNAPENQLHTVLQRFAELGGSVIDTAASYGDSEARIGRQLAALQLRERMFLATKLVGGGLGGLMGATGKVSFERSLQRLKTSRIDLLQVHNLNGIEALLPMMQDWKRAGRIRYIGVTTSSGGQHVEMAAAMRKHELDFVQVDYSLGNRDAAAQVLPLAQERGIAVLANLPLGRASLIRRMIGQPLPPWAAEMDATSWGQLLLKYVISHPAVTCAIPGSTKPAHVIDNQAAGRGRLPDRALRQRIEAYWDGKR
jgi:aryl-alcohol dehydrogenase-like predicted oxidoreductase